MCFDRNWDGKKNSLDIARDNYLADTEEDSHGASCFISFSKEDEKFVRIIYDLLKQGDRKVMVDWEDSPPSSGWLEEIHRRIENYDAFIFVISHASVKSELCNWEVDHAIQNGKRIIPLVCDSDVDFRIVRKELSSLNWIFFHNGAEKGRDSEEMKQSMNLLIKALDMHLRHAQIHTKILRRALKWEKDDFEKSLLFRGDDLQRAQHWLSASALGKEPKPTTLHLSHINDSQALEESMNKRKLIAVFFAFIVAIGILWPTWGVFFFSLVFSHFFVYFSSN